MSLVGALLFCNDCGGLLERCPASQANIDCDVCGKRNKSEFFLIVFFLLSFHLASVGYNSIKSKKKHRSNPPEKNKSTTYSPSKLISSSNHPCPSPTDVWPTSTTTESASTAFPSRLRDARSEIQVLSAEDRETWAMTTTACPQCANPEMRFRDVQLRGADEGSTVFYRCPKCDYK
jgi:DNA-directed RNA polymerase subunit M/transcription elongation factor TFIIS